MKFNRKIINFIIKNIEDKKIKININYSKINFKNLFIRGYPISINTLLDSEYYYGFSGVIKRVTHKGFMTSFVLRSRRFGAEQRFFINSPSINIKLVLPFFKKKKAK